MLITEKFSYAMAHHLPDFPIGHKCRNIHGHLCEAHVTLEVSDEGVAFDHAEFRAAGCAVVRALDHAGVINDLAPELADGTAESQLRYLVPRLQAATVQLGELERVDLDEWSSGGAGILIAHRKSWIRKKRERLVRLRRFGVWLGSQLTKACS